MAVTQRHQRLLEEEELGEVAQRLVSSFLPEMASVELATMLRQSPNYVIQHPAHALALKPHVRTFTGVCLRVDMVELVAAMERALFLGNDALDNFRDNFASNFAGSLVRKVYGWGGDVIKVVDASLLCVFEPGGAMDAAAPYAAAGAASSSSASSALAAAAAAAAAALQKACEAALQCAWELKGSAAGDVGVRVGVSCGEMALAFVGGHDGHWHQLLLGDCLRDLDLLADWPVGTVAVTKDVHTRVTAKDTLGAADGGAAAAAGAAATAMTVTVAPPAAPASKVCHSHHRHHRHHSHHSHHRHHRHHRHPTAGSLPPFPPTAAHSPPVSLRPVSLWQVTPRTAGESVGQRLAVLLRVLDCVPPPNRAKPAVLPRCPPLSRPLWPLSKPLYKPTQAHRAPI